MPLLTILLALGFRKAWGTANPMQQDGWYWRWNAVLGSQPNLKAYPAIQLALAIGLPLVALLVLTALLTNISHWLLLPLGVLVLLYSMGRVTSGEKLDTYISAFAGGDWQLAQAQAEALGVEVVEPDDWAALNRGVLIAAAYRSFEGVFAVFFWFLLLGPAGALLYRLSALSAERDGGAVAARWLWLLEWPAARVLGFSFAITGNFDECIRRWRVYAASETHSSAEVLYESALGALGREDAVPPAASSRALLQGLQSLYRRTYWFWLGVIGVWAIVV